MTLTQRPQRWAHATWLGLLRGGDAGLQCRQWGLQGQARCCDIAPCGECVRLLGVAVLFVCHQSQGMAQSLCVRQKTTGRHKQRGKQKGENSMMLNEQRQGGPHGGSKTMNSPNMMPESWLKHGDGKK